MKAEVTKLKDELAPVYKDKARLTEELMQCRETLSRVRDINEKHSTALDEATGRIRDLQARNKELSQQVDSERATQAVAASELEVTDLAFASVDPHQPRLTLDRNLSMYVVIHGHTMGIGYPPYPPCSDAHCNHHTIVSTGIHHTVVSMQTLGA